MGNSFKILSVHYDPRLTMFPAIRVFSGDARCRLKALLRAQRYYDLPTLVRMYKCHVLSFVEGATPAIYHASPSTLGLLDDLQNEFLREAGLTAESALCDHRLAPLAMRRDIAMLGLLWKVSRGGAPGLVQSLFSLRSTTLEDFGFAMRRRAHGFQIHDPIEPGHPLILRRSIFGSIRVWNLLSVDLVNAKTVQVFQQNLQAYAKSAAAGNERNWDKIFSTQVDS